MGARLPLLCRTWDDGAWPSTKRCRRAQLISRESKFLVIKNCGRRAQDPARAQRACDGRAAQLAREWFQWGPITHRPTMTKRIGKASLAMRPPRRIVQSCQFHIGRASLCGPFYQVIRRVDEYLDSSRGQPHVSGARLLVLARHGLMEKERRAIEVKASNTVEVPQLPGAKRRRIPRHRCGSIRNDQHHRQGRVRGPLAHTRGWHRPSPPPNWTRLPCD